MTTWPSYQIEYHAERRSALNQIHSWMNLPDAPKRVLLLLGPPGSGKTWLTNHLVRNPPQSNQIILWLDAPQLAISAGTTENSLQALNTQAFKEWFDGVLQQSSKFFSGLNSIDRRILLDAQVEQFARALCQYSLGFAPLLIVDGYDELTQSQAAALSLHVLQQFITSSCTRIILNLRSKGLLQGDTLRRNTTSLEIQSADFTFAQEQFQKYFQAKYGNETAPDFSAWAQQYPFYGWKNPAANYFFFAQVLEEKPAALRSLTLNDFQNCLNALLKRIEHPALSDGKEPEERQMCFLRTIAALENPWLASSVEERLGINFYIDPTIKTFLDTGVIINREGLFYSLETTIHQILLQIAALEKTGKEESQ